MPASTQRTARDLLVLRVPESVADNPTVKAMADAGLKVEQMAVLLHKDWKEGQSGRFLLPPDGRLLWLEEFSQALPDDQRSGFALYQPIDAFTTELVKLSEDGQTATLYRRKI